MATLIHRKTGKTDGYEIRFYDPHGRQLSIYLGGRRYGKQTADELKKIVEALVYYRDNAIDTPSKRVLTWLESTSPEIREKLAAVGLIVIPKTHSVSELWDSFLEQKTGKDSTLEQYQIAKARFFDYFKETDQVTDLTKESFAQWKSELLTRLKPATVASQLKHTKTVFNWAVKQGWIEASPLDGVGRGSFVNRSRDRIVTMDEYHRLLDASPCQDWRVINSLVRIGGLRCPSEVVVLRWEDVDWERNCFYVRSPKTEHHEGKEGRIVPIFPELKAELEVLFSEPASKDREYVINRYRDPRQNLGTTFAKIVKRAGIPEIPRPFDNMRMTRSNEIYNRFGAFIESEWIGHSGRVRQDHYLMIQDSDIDEASQWQNLTQKANDGKSDKPE